MTISPTQKAAINEVIEAVLKITQGGRYKRRIADIFLVLPPKKDWEDYYEIIPEPRCLNGVRDKFREDGYRSCLEVLKDLNLVFLNALHYNEDGSQICQDAEKLMSILATEWKARQVLPAPPEPKPSPPPEEPPKPATTPPTTTVPVPSKPPPPIAPTKPTQALAPTASTSRTLALASIPPRPIRPRSPSPEVDVDGERGTPEPDGTLEEEARDDETQAIVAQLERGLPRWEGLADVGWNEDIPEAKFLEIIHALKSHKDVVTGVRYSTSLDSIPDHATISELPYTEPQSLKLLESKARNKGFASSKEFDFEVSKIFLRGRRHYDVGSENYGRVLHLQRLYQSLTSKVPPQGPPYISTTNFASVRSGPGVLSPQPAAEGESGVIGVTSFRVSNKDRTFVDELPYKGWRVRLGDWVHVANAEDPARPVVGQVYRCFVSDEPATKGQPGLTISWYYRPEQTVHPSYRLFWENEVFKTSHFADHSLDDLIERIAVQFTARHIRGRPRPPAWSRGWPLYVCDSRYNDRERCFVRIKNWASCVPEEVRPNRVADWMPVYPFERLVYPRRLASPFVRSKAVRGPGGIGEPLERAEGEKIEGGGTGRKRARRGGAGPGPSPTDTYGPLKGAYVGPASHAPNPVAVAAGATQQQTGYAQQGVFVQAPYAQPAGYAQQQQQAYAQPQYAAQQSVTPAQVLVQDERSVLHAAGGVHVAGSALIERLPAETARLFDRDAQTNEVLWFSAPPVNVARSRAPQHSLAYLHFLAKKRNAAGQADKDGAAAVPAKKARTPSVTELVVQTFRNVEV